MRDGVAPIAVPGAATESADLERDWVYSRGDLTDSRRDWVESRYHRVHSWRNCIPSTRD